MTYTQIPRKQQGVALVFGLFLLLALTMVGLSSMKGSSLQSKIAANKRNMDLAFQSSESALINSETWLMCQSSQGATTTDGQTNIWQEDTPGDLVKLNDSWWQSNATAFGTDIDLEDIQIMTMAEAEPRYVIEQLNAGAVQYGGCVPENLNMTTSSVPVRCLYRITARGTGTNMYTQSIVQSHFALIYPRNQCREAK